MRYTKQELSKLKFRPSLTAEHIQTIMYIAKEKYIELSSSASSASSTSNSSSSHIEVSKVFNIISVLGTIEAKINAGIASPAYILKEQEPSTSTLESLGGAIPHIPPIPPYDDSIGVPETNLSSLPLVSKEEVWAASYAKYLLDPISCTLQEIEEAREHKYLNDLMNKEEVEAFELSERVGE